MGIDIAVSCTDSRCVLNGCDTEASPQVSYCCGDGTCSGLETEMNCAIDECVELCGNGSCDVEEGENVSTCPVDCTCGDYVCNYDLGENVENCPTDCSCNAN